MLTPDYLDSISSDIVKIYSSLELEIIKQIAIRIAKVGYANTVVQDNARILQEIGILQKDIINKVAEYNNMTETEISKVFVEAGIETLKFDDNIYKDAGLNPLPIQQSKSMLQLLTTTANKTNKNLNNLVKTTAKTTQNDFITTMNKAYLEVSSGAKSYSQSIVESIKELSTKNTLVEYPSGHKTSIESAVRMNIKTGISQTCGKLQEMRADEMNWDLMEITAHGGARPEHAVWQGKIVSRRGRKGYLSYKDIGYGTATGFKGVNCGHDWYPYYKGSTRTYTNKELEEMQNETVTINGKKVSKYEVTQLQRQTERNIRQNKKELVGLQAIVDSATDNKLLEDAKTAFAKQSLIYNSNLKELNSITKQINTRIDNTRLYIGNNYNKGAGSKVANVTKITNQYNNSDLIGLKVNGTEIKEIGEHIISRTYGRTVSFENVENTLKNPVKYSTIRDDRSQQIKGENCTVVINVDTGKLITVISKKTKRKE